MLMCSMLLSHAVILCAFVHASEFLKGSYIWLGSFRPGSPVSLQKPAT